jgi:hypothetical protein
MSEVPRPKKLTRWIYRGKSYGCKLSAFKRMAKDELIKEFEPVWEWAHELMEDEGPLGVAGDYSEEQLDNLRFRPWEDRFPLAPGYIPVTKEGLPRRFDYQAYKQWLTERAYELMREAGV